MSKVQSARAAPKCPKCKAEGIRVRLIEEICGDTKPRYTCPNFAPNLWGISPAKKCDVEYFNEDGAF